MSEFERECEEYGCPPVTMQWDNVVDMLLAQSEPKNHKKEKKIWEDKWSQICIENGWDNPDKTLVSLAPKVRDMEKKVHMRLKKHVESEGNVSWMNRKKHKNQEEEYRTEVRLWTKIALTATALSPKKKGEGEQVKAEKSKRELERKTGSIEGSMSDQAAGAPPPRIYPDLHTERPPPYVPNQQVQVTVKETAVEVEMAELDFMRDQIRVLTERLDRTPGANSHNRAESRCSEASYHQDPEGGKGFEHGSQYEEESDEESKLEKTKGLNIVITGVMNVNGEVTPPVASRTRSSQPQQGPPGTSKNWDVPYPPPEQIREGGRNAEDNTHSTQLSSAFQPSFQAPLLMGNQGPKYQPWSHGDMNAVLAKLPPITSGGGRWLSKLMALCHGTTLAVGDIRCLLGQIFTASQMSDFEKDAGMDDTPNHEPYTTISTNMGTVLRKQFPTPPTTYQNIKFRIKPGETGAGYYFRCAAEWEQMVEENSLNNPITRDIFRSAVMSGAPNGVKQVMEGNPDIPVATNEVWERHLVFHIDRTVDKLHKDEEELEKTKNQLLKLQLDLARASGPKKTKQMSQQSVSEPTDPSPVPPYFGYDQGWPLRGNWGGNRGQRGGNMGYRGKGGRGRAQQGGGCFVCCSSEQWKADCPSQQRGCQFTGPPAGGWGPLRGGPGGRGRGPHTSRYPGQQHSSPANLQAPMHPTWGPEGDAGDC